MRYIYLSLLLILCSCTIKTDSFDGKFLRMDTQTDHASIERVKGIGSKLTVVSETGFPEWWIGNIDHTQVFLPKLKCTTFYREDGTNERMECEEMSPVDIENNLKGMDGVVGDRISSGDATELEASFGQSIESSSIWIEAMKAAVAKSTLESADKQEAMEALQALGQLLLGEE